MSRGKFLYLQTHFFESLVFTSDASSSASINAGNRDDPSVSIKRNSPHANTSKIIINFLHFGKLFRRKHKHKQKEKEKNWSLCLCLHQGRYHGEIRIYYCLRASMIQVWLCMHGRRKGVAGCNSFESFPGFPLFKLGMNDVMNTHFSIWRWRKKPVPGCSYPQKLHGRGWNIPQEGFQHFAFSESRGVRCFLFHDKPREAFYSHWSFESNMLLLLVCDDRKSAKLQNIRLVICISLNNRSAHCVMFRCLKRSDTCGWSGWVLWSWKFSFLVVRNNSL